MAITFVASSGASLSANNNTTDVSLPSGIQEGDVIILEAASDGDFVGQDRIDPVDTLDAGSQGWFLLDVNDGSQGALCDGVTMAYVVPASPPTTVRLRAGDNDVAARLYAYRGVDPRVLDAWLGPDGGITGSSASPNPPSITTNTNGALVHASFHMDDDDTTVNSYSSGYTNGSSQNTGQSSNSIGATVGAASKIVATAGTESPAAISTNGNDAWIARSFALLPDQGEVENWAVQFLGASYGELDASTTGNSVSSRPACRKMTSYTSFAQRTTCSSDQARPAQIILPAGLRLPGMAPSLTTGYFGRSWAQRPILQYLWMGRPAFIKLSSYVLPSAM